MTWANFYLLCFVIGILFSIVSFLLGGFDWHLPFDVHLPHDGMPHVHVGSDVHAGHGAGHAHGHSNGDSRPGVSFLNPMTGAAFLAWFGGMGYLLTRYSTIWFMLDLTIAMASGLVGAGIIFLFMSKILVSEHENLNPDDFVMVGVLGRVSMSIRENGTGEIIYSQGGTRRTCGARAESGAIAKGEEVVVTRYEKGIAYVRAWSEIAGETDTGVGDGKKAIKIE
jgi:membrane protein implicated in regulation of membrane protease activity